MHILGISCFYHDSAACLVSGGDIVAAAQQERFSRKKHDPSFPVDAARYCLDEAGIGVEDLACMVFYDKPFLTFERLLLSYLHIAPRGVATWVRAMPAWLRQKLLVPKIVEEQLGFEGDVLYTEHHEAHAGAAYYPSPFDEAAILTVDGVGEWATASYGVGRGRGLELHRELQFPDSLGLLYSAFTYFTGFRVNSGEYKLMGLAPFGKPVYRDLILDELVDLKGDGSLRLNQKYFSYVGGTRMCNKRFARLFGGPARKPETRITRREMDIAASIQAVTEEAVLRMARHVASETGQRRLCLAGGVALNCVANGKLLREGIFEDIWIQPAAGDAGGALGAALCAWHRYYEKDRASTSDRDRQKGSLLGPAFNAEAVRGWLDEHGYPHHRLAADKRAAAVAREIAKGNVVGHMAGRMEFGPRALGARSILGDPRREDIQEVMNKKIKFRESFRPFAPAVLEEKASEYFAIDRPSPYMLLVADVVPERRLPVPEQPDLGMMDRIRIPRSDIPAVTHLDYSARPQTVNRETDPVFYDVIREFEKLTGCAVVVNTSFNVRGEPIVCTPEDAYLCFMRTDLDVLVIEDCMLYKKEQRPLVEGNDWRENLELD
ncbi:MAG: carbamoyltransferase [Desulfatibacillaceae bacterium]